MTSSQVHGTSFIKKFAQPGKDKATTTFTSADKRTRILYHTETQDVNEDHKLYKEWADSRIVDRFRSHQMQVKKYAAKYGCSRIVNLMIRPTLTFASKAVRKFFQKAVKDYKSTWS